MINEEFISGQIYAVDGLASNGESVGTVEIYDPYEKEWRTGEQMSVMRSKINSLYCHRYFFELGLKPKYFLLHGVLVSTAFLRNFPNSGVVVRFLLGVSQSSLDDLKLLGLVITIKGTPKLRWRNKSSAFAIRRVIPLFKIFLQNSTGHSAKFHSKDNFNGTQSYKMQVKLLHEFANLIISLNIDGCQVNEISETVPSYLCNDQCQKLQTAALSQKQTTSEKDILFWLFP
uniref:TTI1 C-terminal TPR domain-containing protein n=1 Tax=Glossina pallidipes TaxID=7398 RepID=A0A1A9ZGB2_GLOPL